jgi:dTDP-4-dehydrorhamnose reductase
MREINFLTLVVVRASTDVVVRRAKVDAAMSKAGALRVDQDVQGLWEVRAPVTTRDVAHALHGILEGEDEVRFYVPTRRGELTTYRVAGGAI